MKVSAIMLEIKSYAHNVDLEVAQPHQHFGFKSQSAAIFPTCARNVNRESASKHQLYQTRRKLSRKALIYHAEHFISSLATSKTLNLI